MRALGCLLSAVLLSGCVSEPMPGPSRTPTAAEIDTCSARIGKAPIAGDRSGGTFMTEQEARVYGTCLHELTG